MKATQTWSEWEIKWGKWTGIVSMKFQMKEELLFIILSYFFPINLFFFTIILISKIQPNHLRLRSKKINKITLKNEKNSQCLCRNRFGCLNRYFPQFFFFCFFLRDYISIYMQDVPWQLHHLWLFQRIYRSITVT